MTVGAQLYSVRKQMQTPGEIRAGFQRLKAMGYDNVQVSGIGQIDPAELRDVSAETGLPVVCTHTPWQRIVEDTDRVIAEHRLFGCPEIGLGAMDKSFRDSEEGLDRFLSLLEKPVAKILDAGLHFAYHNHAFEFAGKTADGRNFYDALIGRCPDWHFIPDVYWIAYAGADPAEYIRRLGGERIPNVHFKDMAKTADRGICPCGEGVMDFAKLGDVCREVGVRHILIEQDNATDRPDPFGDMETSLRHLRSLGL